MLDDSCGEWRRSNESADVQREVSMRHWFAVHINKAASYYRCSINPSSVASTFAWRPCEFSRHTWTGREQVCARVASTLEPAAIYRVTFIGDSLSRQHSLVLAALSEADAAASHELCFGSAPVKRTIKSAGGGTNRQQVWEVSSCWTACDARLVISWVRSNHLDTGDAASDGRDASAAVELQQQRARADAPETLWAHPAVVGAADVIIFGTGSHHVSDQLLGLNLQSAMDYARKHAKPGAAVFITLNSPGHGGCGNLTEPFRSIADAEAYLNAPTHTWYHGASTKRQNEIATTLFGPDATLDTYGMAVMRGDAHVSPSDCLHFCLPGPLTAWVDLLLTRALLRRTRRKGRPKGKAA